MKKIAAVIVLFLVGCSWAQNDDERIYVTSCSLFIKTTPYMPDSGDASGKAMVEATLCDKSGIPIPDQEIKMTATCGKLSCLSMDTYSPAGSASPGRSCFITGRDGKIQVFLSDIPFNKPGRVKASCAYGDFRVHASSSFSITRKIIKKGNRSKSASRAQASVQ
jgi:hypothetical protein